MMMMLYFIYDITRSPDILWYPHWTVIIILFSRRFNYIFIKYIVKWVGS